MRSLRTRFISAGRAVRLRQVAILVLVSVAAGLVGEWLRPSERLVLPRPLPVFVTTPPAHE